MSNRVEMLQMFDIAKQRHIRGGINAAYARASSTGRQDAAVVLFRQAVATLGGRPDERGYQAELEKFQPARLIAAIRDRLEGLPELADPGLDAAELRRRQNALQALRAKGAGRLVQDALRLASQHLEELLAGLRESLLAAYAARPDQARPLAEQIRRALNNLPFPPIVQEPFVKLQRALSASEQIHARRGQLMPASAEFIMVQLAASAHGSYRVAVAMAATELAESAFRQLAPAIQTLCDELIGRGAEFQNRLLNVLSELVTRQKEAAQDQTISRASVVLAVPGPDEKQVMAGMIAQAGCADVGQLTARLLDAFEARLRQLAPEQCPYLDANTAPLADLVRGLEARQLADAFDHVVEEGLGGGHTLYELIAKAGIESVAEFLYERAAPTIHLGERDIESFNVSPIDLAIVRMPPPNGPRDPAIREQLIATLHRIAALHRLESCTIADGAIADRTLTVVRLHAGYPIGIDTANRALLDRYLRSGARGHLPHLLGVVPEAPLGKHIKRIGLLSDDSMTTPEVGNEAQ